MAHSSKAFTVRTSTSRSTTCLACRSRSKATDAYANFSIYGGHKTFPFPGLAIWNGVGGSTAPPTTPPPTTTPPSTPPPTSVCASLYNQCDGSGFTGPRCCSSGTCRVSNQWYSQCL